jgi:hypothetical protein
MHTIYKYVSVCTSARAHVYIRFFQSEGYFNDDFNTDNVKNVYLGYDLFAVLTRKSHTSYQINLQSFYCYY